ncbi:Hypothetical predicted protein [Cloeon dipterum]|uniref:Uncharacterized protein n=1 Tax=Cloeon dipterum TaxID=197152 RepID=A0A8S1D081_9INSE|nr:Hypothetical predicted protein [Cloeon dipterum]
MADDTPTLLLLDRTCTCCCVHHVSVPNSDRKLLPRRRGDHQPVLAGKHFLWLLAAFLFISMLATAEASTIRQIGDAALCPFEAKQDKDDTRMPAVITQLTCKFSKSSGNSDTDDPEPAGVTCEQIGGTCKQIHTNLQVSYAKSTIPNRPERSVKDRVIRSIRRHHNIRVNSACVCVRSNGRPATPVGPNFEVRRR